MKISRLARNHIAAEQLNMYDGRSIVNNIIEDHMKVLCQQNGEAYNDTLVGSFLNDQNGDAAFTQAVSALQQGIDTLTKAIDDWSSASNSKEDTINQ